MHFACLKIGVLLWCVCLLMRFYSFQLQLYLGSYLTTWQGWWYQSLWANDIERRFYDQVSSFIILFYSYCLTSVSFLLKKYLIVIDIILFCRLLIHPSHLSSALIFGYTDMYGLIGLRALLNVAYDVDIWIFFEKIFVIN